MASTGGASGSSDNACGPRTGNDAGEGAPGEPIPEAVRRATRRAFDARIHDADVADLVHDSLIDEADFTTAGEARRLRFVAGTTTVELEISYLPDGLDVALSLTPPQPATVAVRVDDELTRMSVPDCGNAAFELPPNTLASLVIRGPQLERGLQTAWVTF